MDLNLPAKNLPIVPIKRHELHEAIKERVHLINQEFSEGFDFIQNFPKSVSFFGSSKFDENNKYYKDARLLAQNIVKKLGYCIVTGGGPGIMEAANRGAYESGGKSLGLTIEIPEGQAINPYITDHIDFYYFFSRKVCLSFSAEAYVFFPGGFGTMDELFEILTLVQTHKIYNVPVILFGSDFWKSMEDFMKKEMISRDVIDDQDIGLYKITDNFDEVIDIIKNTPLRDASDFDEASIQQTKEETLG